MTTRTVTATNTAYELASITSDVLLTLESVHSARVVFATSLPAFDTEDYLTLNSESRGLVKVNGVPAGNIYIRAATENGIRMSVSE